MHSLADEEVLDNKYLATHASCDTFNTTPHCQPLKPCVYEDEVDLRVIVMTFNRCMVLNTLSICVILKTTNRCMILYTLGICVHLMYMYEKLLDLNFKI